MLDGCKREIDYIRISITDRCNLRCRYCMPVDGVEMTTHEELLSLDEILRLCQIMSELGIHKVKLTGGEPLIRRNLETLVKELKSMPGIDNVTLTTNGVLLGEQMPALAAAGIDSINISLDSLNPKVFQEITRVGDLERVKAGIAKALEYPEVVTKINCVPFSIPEQRVWELAQYARDHKIHVRYIEMMPIGLGREYKCMTQEEIMEELASHYGPLTPYEKRLGNGPCKYWQIEGFQGKIGFISAVSHKFCGECNRIRLTSQGFLKTCLQYEEGGDLKGLLRSGADDETLKQAIQNIILHKPVEHSFETIAARTKDGRKEQKIMSQIGG